MPCIKLPDKKERYAYASLETNPVAFDGPCHRACSSKPVEQAATEVPAPPPAEVAASSEPSQPIEPPPVPVAKPSTVKKSAANTAPATPVREAPVAATVKENVAPAPAPKKPEPVVIPAGTELNAVLTDPLNSGKNKAGDEFSANLAAPIYVNGATILERGAKLQGTVVAADGAGRVSGKATMTIALTGVMHKGKIVPITTKDVAAEAESSTGRDATMIGGGAGIGAIIGAIAGGKKGAAVGAAVGGASGTGAVLATKGKEVDFPAEFKLTSRWIKNFRSCRKKPKNRGQVPFYFTNREYWKRVV